MAQQVKFHNVTQQAYSGISSPSSGDLYFISDNGEIRKGSQHITGTRVFTAIDPSTSGCSAVDDLDVKYNGTALKAFIQKTNDEKKPLYKDGSGNETTEAKTGTTDNEKVMIQDPTGEYPKRGDMLLVSHYITTTLAQRKDKDDNLLYWATSEKSGDPSTTVTAYPVMDTVPDTNGPEEKTAYVYNGSGGDYDSANWQACDGKVDASKVILTQNITMAGNYTSIGNFSKTNAAGKNSTFMDGGSGTAGKSVYELIKQMLSKTSEPTWKRNPPTASLSASGAGSVEYGTQVSSTFTATFNDAYASFDGGGNQMAGCSASKYHFDGDATGTTTKTTTKTWYAGVDSVPSATVTIDYSASKNTMKNNLGDTSTTISPSSIVAGTTAQASATATVSTYRNNFYLIRSAANSIADADLETTLTSDFIRTNGTKVNGTISSISASNFKQVFVFVQNNNKTPSFETAKGLPYTTINTGKTVTIKGAAGDTTGISYKVWKIEPGSPVDSDTIKVTWA